MDHFEHAPSNRAPLVTGSLTRAVSQLVTEVHAVLALVTLPWERDLSRRPDLRTVRAGARRHLEPAVHPDALVDVLVVVGELVENAYRHTVAPRRLRVCREGCAVRVEVTDGDPTEPVPHLAPSARARCHGMSLVHELCHEWGVRPAADGAPGKTVWGVVSGHPER